jgi:hypothetical protein
MGQPDQVHLDTLSTELLAVMDQPWQPDWGVVMAPT